MSVQFHQQAADVRPVLAGARGSTPGGGQAIGAERPLLDGLTRPR